MAKIIINAERQGYGVDQIRRTMTVGELIAMLSDYDEDDEVYLGHDMKSYGWYTYGGITEDDFLDDERCEYEFEGWGEE